MATAYDAFRDLDPVASAPFDTRRGPRRMPMDLYRDGDHSVLSVTIPVNEKAKPRKIAVASTDAAGTASPARTESVEPVEP